MRISVRYNISEKVFAMRQAAETQPLKGGDADDEIRFFRVDFYLRVMRNRSKGMRKAAHSFQA